MLAARKNLCQTGGFVEIAQKLTEKSRMPSAHLKKRANSAYVVNYWRPTAITARPTLRKRRRSKKPTTTRGRRWAYAHTAGLPRLAVPGATNANRPLEILPHKHLKSRYDATNERIVEGCEGSHPPGSNRLCRLPRLRPPVHRSAPHSSRSLPVVQIDDESGPIRFVSGRGRSSARARPRRSNGLHCGNCGNQ